jgi:hypothetical protein
VNQLQKAWLENEEKKETGAVTRAPASKRAASIAFKTDDIQTDDLPVHVQSQPRR